MTVAIHTDACGRYIVVDGRIYRPQGGQFTRFRGRVVVVRLPTRSAISVCEDEVYSEMWTENGL
jgi:hypothetical protein